MIRFIAAFAVAAFALLSASCCCTSEVKAPGLRPLPNFRQIETTTVEEEVEYSK